MPATAKGVAKWMADKMSKSAELYQEDVVWEIQSKFGKRFVYENENGNLAISRTVLKEFRKLTEDTVVWERGSRLWRKRQSYDAKGKRQAEY
jgi:CRISPR/Cas system CSM-associated protein Csm3 (group 7 of RAMP superfamily)